MTHDHLRSFLEPEHGKFLCKHPITSSFDTYIKHQCKHLLDQHLGNSNEQSQKTVWKKNPKTQTTTGFIVSRLVNFYTGKTPSTHRNDTQFLVTRRVRQAQ